MFKTLVVILLSLLKNPTMYKVTFKRGLRSPIEVEAENENEAKKKGLEYYRKNLTYMSFRAIDQIVEKVEEL